MPGVLVIVPAGEDHTLGAILLSSQLRRRGYCVTLVLGAQAESLTLELQGSSFHTAMISTSFGHHLGELHALVAAARLFVEEEAPVLIGDAITEARIDITGATGADHVTTDADEALRFMTLKAVKAVTDPA